VATRTHRTRIATMFRWQKYFTVCITYQPTLVTFNVRTVWDPIVCTNYNV